MFVRRDSIGRSVSDIKVIPEGYLLSDLGSKDSIAGVFLYDTDHRTIRRLLGNINGIRDNSSFELVSFDDSIGFMTSPFDHRIYHYKNTIRDACPFRTTPKVSKKYDYDSDIMEVTDLRKTSYMESRYWILTTYWSHSKGLRTMLYNKKTNTYQVGEKWVNDIDNIEPGYKTSNCDNNMFILCDIDDKRDMLTLQFLYLKQTFSPQISPVLNKASSK